MDYAFYFLVAEQAESIDNPMHEAAKRGKISHIYFKKCFCLKSCCNHRLLAPLKNIFVLIFVCFF